MISKNQIKYIQSLHQKKHREIEKRFIAEGIKTCLEIIETSSEIIETLYATEHFIQKHHSLLLKHNIKHTTVSEAQLKQISSLITPNETLAVCNHFNHPNPTIDLNSEFTFYLDGIRDPGNLGTIIRVCSWFGIKELFCSEDTVELYNPKCIQACMGAFLRVKIFYLPLHKLLDDNKAENIYAADLKGKSVYEIKNPTGVVIIGNEANGISNETLKLATELMTIPSANSHTESLNAAVASSIIASEFFRKKIS